MLQLTALNGDTILVTPEHIASVIPAVVDSDLPASSVELITGTEFIVGGTPNDIARLRAAWERRYTASRITDNNDLPVLVYMDGEGDTRAIRFMCCALTAELNRKARGRGETTRSAAGGPDLDLRAGADQGYAG